MITESQDRLICLLCSRPHSMDGELIGRAYIPRTKGGHIRFNTKGLTSNPEKDAVLSR